MSKTLSKDRILSVRSFSRHVALLTAFLIAFPALLAGCSLADQVARLTNEARFSEARRLLENSKAGGVPDEKLGEDAIRARDIYSTAISKYYDARISQLLSIGKARAALADSVSALELCEWCGALTSLHAKCQSNVSLVDDLTSEAESLLGFGNDASDLRDLLNRADAVSYLLGDSPDTIRRLDDLRHQLLAHWHTLIPRFIAEKNFDQIHSFTNDLQLARVPRSEADYLSSCLFDLFRIHRTDPIEASGQIHRLLESIGRDEQSSWLSSSGTAGIRKCIRSSLLRWTQLSYLSVADKWASRFDAIDAAEAICSFFQSEVCTEFEKALFEAHKSRGVDYASLGIESVMSLIHFERASQLSEVSRRKSPSEQDALAAARASVESRLPISKTIAIDLGQRVAPELADVVRMALFLHISQSTKPIYSWEWCDPIHGDPEFVIYVTDVQSYYPSIDQLARRSSRYLSHYQNVPNPRIQELSTLVASARIQLNTAHSYYNSAVYAHNLYPTYTSLATVNYAYSSYVSQLSYLNTLVDAYNLTPATIEEAVYTPYAFHEGTLELGWEISGEVRYESHTRVFQSRHVDSDFVRIGTRSTDISPMFRRDDAIDIAFDYSIFAKRLLEASEDVRREVGRLFVRDGVFQNVGQSRTEVLAVGVALFPFRDAVELSEPSLLPPWLSNAIPEIESKSRDLTPPCVELTHVAHRGQDLTPETVWQTHSDHICHVRTSGPLSNARGTGSLISKDGHILTCAHVILGSTVEIEFGRGPHKGLRKARTLFVNPRNDVAILQAIGLDADSWLSVRLDDPPRVGEEIVSIGNPSLEDGTTLENSITRGIVSMSETDTWGSVRMVADILVSSGSSGGPIISLRTGEIIGVVTAVGGPRIDQNLASSGYVCLAAPTHMLTDWLGFKTKHGGKGVEEGSPLKSQDYLNIP